MATEFLVGKTCNKVTQAGREMVFTKVSVHKLSRMMAKLKSTLANGKLQ